MSDKVELGKITNRLKLQLGNIQEEQALHLINLHHYGDEEVPFGVPCTEAHKAAAAMVFRGISLDFEIIIFSDGSKEWRVKQSEVK